MGTFLRVLAGTCSDQPSSTKTSSVIRLVFFSLCENTDFTGSFEPMPILLPFFIGRYYPLCALPVIFSYLKASLFSICRGKN